MIELKFYPWKYKPRDLPPLEIATPAKTLFYFAIFNVTYKSFNFITNRVHSLKKEKHEKLAEILKLSNYISRGIFYLLF